MTTPHSIVRHRSLTWHARRTQEIEAQLAATQAVLATAREVRLDWVTGVLTENERDLNNELDAALERALVDGYTPEDLEAEVDTWARA